MKARFKRPLDDSKDKSAFFLAFFIGIFGILGPRIVGDSYFDAGLNFIDFLAIAFAIFIIFAYGLYISSTRDRSSISIDRASDNIYYLGLLFTLSSLAYSLVKLALFSTGVSTPSSEGVEFRGGQIISLLPDFGLALFSTIAGIFGRIFLQQMRSDPLDVETDAREELGLSIRELRMTIGEVVGQLNALSAQTRVSLTELSQNVSQTLTETAEKSLEAYDVVSGGIGRVSDGLEQQAMEIAEHSSKTSQQFGEILSAIKGHLDKTAELPVSMSDAFSEVTSNLTEISSRLTETSVSQRELSTSLISTIEKLHSVFSDNDWKDFSIQIEKIHSNFASLAGEASSLSTQLSGAKSRVDGDIQKIAEAGDELVKSGAVMVDTSQAVEKAGETYVETLIESASKLRDQTDEIR
jgi:hypothetical protein